MKKTQRITSLLLALVLAAGLLLPAVPSVRATDGGSATQAADEASPAQAAGGEAESAPEEWAEAEKRPSVIQGGADEMPDIVVDDDGYIHSFVIKHALTKPGDSASFYGKKFNTSLPVGVDYYDFGSYLSGIYKPDNQIDFNGKLIEKDTGREVDISKTSTETIQRKDYTLRISVTPGYGSHPFSQTQLKLADDLQVYLRHHTDNGITERYTYLPAAQICHGERPYELWVEFDLDYSYSDVYAFEKKGIDLGGNPINIGVSVAWHNKDDLFGDGTVSYDPETGILSLKGDVTRFWLSRWTDSEPPRISVDDDINVEEIILSAPDVDRVVIGGPGTLNLGKLSNGWNSKLVLSNCNAYFEEWDMFSRVELENTRLSLPADGYINHAGILYDKDGNQLEGNVGFQRTYATTEDSGTVGGIQWRYDFITKTFTVSGAGKFERLAPYDQYLDVMESFRTEFGVTELGDELVKDSLHLRKVFLARSIKRIGRNNFAGCTRLTEANFPVGLEYIMRGCFSGSGLKTVSFPKTLLRIDDDCFSEMPRLESITFAYENEPSFLVVGDGCFAHLPQVKTLKCGDGPWIVGSGSFCDMPQLVTMRKALLWDSMQEYQHRIYFGESLYSIGDYSFSDLPNVNYQAQESTMNSNYLEWCPFFHQFYHMPWYLRDIGRGSLGYVSGEAIAINIATDSDPSGLQRRNYPAPRYAWANRQSTGMNIIPAGDTLPSEEFPMGIIARIGDDVVSEDDIQALLEYLNRPLKVTGPGGIEVNDGDRTPGSDIDFSGKVDHKDLILLKRRVAGWDGLDRYFDRDYLVGPFETGEENFETRRSACEANYTAETGLKLAVGSATVEYAAGTTLRIPVSSVENTGYIGGSVTAKWDAEAMELIGIEYNNALAPENGTGEIVNDLSYELHSFSGANVNQTLDYAGEQVIRFGNDFRTTNITGTGTLFTLVFRLREGAKPSPYSSTKTNHYEVKVKGFDVYDADLNFVRGEQSQAGDVTVTAGNAEIRDIHVAEIGTPFAGQHPAYTAALPVGVNYKLEENTALGNVFWATKTSGGSVSLMQPYESFEAGKEYTVFLYFEPTSSVFRFAPAETLSGTINNKYAAEAWVNSDGTEAQLSYTFTCTEGVPVTDLILNSTAETLTVGESTNLWVTAYNPYGATDFGVTWTSSDSSVAAVEPSGRVTALKAGEAVITATTVNCGKQASCAVTVQKRGTKIYSVSVSGVVPPVDGKLPKQAASAPAGAGYRVSDTSAFGRGVVWLKPVDGNTYHTVGESESFQAGKEYLAWVYVEPVESATDVYRFPSKEEMNATLNSKLAEVQWVNDDGTQACVQYRFTCTKNYVNPFVDVHESDFFFNPVMWAYYDGITAGTDDTHFSPYNTVMRCDSMVFFWAAKGRPAHADIQSPFKDVKKKHWYYDAVMWAVENHITAGTDATHFSPKNTCSRSEILQFFYAAMNRPAYTIENPYSDVKPKHWYYEGAIWAYENGLEKGENGRYNAKTPCTRGYIVTYLYRFIMKRELAE